MYKKPSLVNKGKLAEVDRSQSAPELLAFADGIHQMAGSPRISDLILIWLGLGRHPG
jgi:hypothetical protein